MRATSGVRTGVRAATGLVLLTLWLLAAAPAGASLARDTSLDSNFLGHPDEPTYVADSDDPADTGTRGEANVVLLGGALGGSGVCVGCAHSPVDIRDSGDAIAIHTDAQQTQCTRSTDDAPHHVTCAFPSYCTGCPPGYKFPPWRNTIYVDLAGGADNLDASAMDSVQVTAHGADGADYIRGGDRADSQLDYGVPGVEHDVFDDRLTGGGGEDTIVAGDGKDWVYVADDHAVDHVSCGANGNSIRPRDQVVADYFDVVDPDCEDVEIHDPAADVTITSSPSPGNPHGPDGNDFEFCAVDGSGECDTTRPGGWKLECAVVASDRWGQTSGTPVYSDCSSGKASYSSLASGFHSFLVHSVTSLARGPDARVTWEVVPPADTKYVDVSPVAGTNSGRWFFDFASEPSGKSVFCRVKKGTGAYGEWFFCPSQYAYPNDPDARLEPGQYTVEAAAYNDAGYDPTPASHTFTVPGSGVPETLLTAAEPVEGSEGRRWRFDFASDPSGGATFECRKTVGSAAPGAWQACSSPSYWESDPDEQLAEGHYKFEVRARNSAGPDASPAARSFDVKPPLTVSITGATPERSSSRDAQVFFSSLDGSATLECRLDGSPAEFASCESPATYHALGDGEHVLEVRAKRGGEVSAPVTHRWTVDATPPVTTLTDAPSGNVASTDAHLVFSANEPSGFLCSLDGAPETPCSSPRDLYGLRVGQHTFHVRARDLLGNPEATPRRATWTVVKPSRPRVCLTGKRRSFAKLTKASGCTADPPCPARRRSRVQTSTITVIALDRVACFRQTSYRIAAASPLGSRYPELVGEHRDLWASPGPVMVNGIAVTLTKGLFIVDPHAQQLLTTNPAVLDVGPSEALPVRVGPVLVDPLKLAPSGGSVKALSRKDPNTGKLRPPTIGTLLEVAALHFVKFSGADGGTTTVDLSVKMPKVFPSEQTGNDLFGQPDAKLTIATSSYFGLSFLGQLDFGDGVLYGKVPLRQVILKYKAGLFDGQAYLQLPGKNAPALGINLGIDRSGNVRRLSVEVGDTEGGGINRPLGSGFFLQSLGLGMRSPPLELRGTLGATFGPVILGRSLFSFNGVGRLFVPSSAGAAGSAPQFWPFELDGTGKIFSVADYAGHIVVRPGTRSSPDFLVSVRGGVTWGDPNDPKQTGVRFTGAGDASPRAANIEAHGTGRVEANVPGVGHLSASQGADAVASTRGLAACWNQNGKRVGVAFRWGQAVQTFKSGCDIAPYRHPVTAARP